MKRVFDACQPRPEVLKGELKDEIFAASLKKVIDGKAEDVYRDPKTFFENTYPTAALKNLLAEALGRLTGAKAANRPIIRLETAFGGGKTHNLIAAYHICKSKIDPSWVKDMLDPKMLPGKPFRKIAGIVGTDLDPVNGLDHGDVTTYTPWGEIAYQLGLKDGYKLVEKSDLAGTAPGAGVLEKLVGDEPALIMIDEIARYLRVAKGKMVGKSTLADQIAPFLMSLFEMAAAKSNVVVIYTLAGLDDAFRQETEGISQVLQEAMRESKSVSARKEFVITSAGETEIASIVSHRLFRKVDRAAGKEAGSAYSTYFDGLMKKGCDLPAKASRVEYAQEIECFYPFHPEIINTLSKKTATIPNFQRTRGALRLLAMVVRRIWDTKPSDAYLIHPHHLDLGVEDILNDLTSRLDRPQYKDVAEADVVSLLPGSKAHAQLVDEPLVHAGKPAFAQRAATTIFLHSLTQGIASGVDPAEMRLAVLSPGDDPALVDKVIDRMLNDTSGGGCWFLDYDGRHFRFKTEASINKIISEEMQHVGTTKSKTELDTRIKTVWKKGALAPFYFPSEASDVDDDAGPPKLCVMQYDAATAEAGDSVPPEVVIKIFEHAGASGGYRTYKNNVVFLLADRPQVDHMVEMARRYLAIHKITSDPDRMNAFNDEQKKKLKTLRETSELDLRVSITRAYRFLYYPSADAPQKAGNLHRETLPAQEQGEVEKDQTTVVLRALKQLDKVLTADDKPLAAAFVKAKAWAAGKEEVSTDEIRKTFAQRMGLRMLLDPNQLKTTIKDGCRQGVWVYYNPEEGKGYGADSPSPLVQIGENTVLYTPAEAKRLGVLKETPPPSPETCPVCRNPATACTCAKAGCLKCGKDPCVCKKTLRAEGLPAQAFQAIADQCHDSGVKDLQSLTVQLEGADKDTVKAVEALGIAVPQLGNVQCSVEVRMAAEFGYSEKIVVDFRGNWDRYRRLRTVTDAFGKEASKASVNIMLQIEHVDGLAVTGEHFQQVRDVFTSLISGKMVVKAEPMAETAGGIK